MPIIHKLTNTKPKEKEIWQINKLCCSCWAICTNKKTPEIIWSKGDNLNTLGNLKQANKNELK